MISNKAALLDKLTNYKPSVRLQILHNACLPTSFVVHPVDGSLYYCSENILYRLADDIYSVIAGAGSLDGISSDGYPAIESRLRYPKQLCFDINGNLYVTERHGNRVRVIFPNGIIDTFVGRRTGIYTLHSPEGIAVDRNGNFYIADVNNNAVRMVDRSGVITTVAGNGKQPATSKETGTYDGKLAVEAKVCLPHYVACHGETLYVLHMANLDDEMGPGVISQVVDGLITTIVTVVDTSPIVTDYKGRLYFLRSELDAYPGRIPSDEGRLSTYIMVFDPRDASITALHPVRRHTLLAIDLSGDLLFIKNSGENTNAEVRKIKLGTL